MGDGQRGLAQLYIGKSGNIIPVQAGIIRTPDCQAGQFLKLKFITISFIKVEINGLVF